MTRISTFLFVYICYRSPNRAIPRLGDVVTEHYDEVIDVNEVKEAEEELPTLDPNNPVLIWGFDDDLRPKVRYYQFNYVLQFYIHYFYEKLIWWICLVDCQDSHLIPSLRTLIYCAVNECAVAQCIECYQYGWGSFYYSIQLSMELSNMIINKIQYVISSFII